MKHPRTIPPFTVQLGKHMAFNAWLSVESRDLMQFKCEMVFGQKGCIVKVTLGSGHTDLVHCAVYHWVQCALVKYSTRF